MKRQKFTPCLMCGKGVMHFDAGGPVFLRVQIEYFGLNIVNIQRAAGLEIAHGPLAAILGPDDDLATQVTQGSGLVCSTCMLKTTVPFSLLEAANG